MFGASNFPPPTDAPSRPHRAHSGVSAPSHTQPPSFPPSSPACTRSGAHGRGCVSEQVADGVHFTSGHSTRLASAGAECGPHPGKPRVPSLSSPSLLWKAASVRVSSPQTGRPVFELRANENRVGPPPCARLPALSALSAPAAPSPAPWAPGLGGEFFLPPASLTASGSLPRRGRRPEGQVCACCVQNCLTFFQRGQFSTDTRVGARAAWLACAQSAGLPAVLGLCWRERAASPRSAPLGPRWLCPATVPSVCSVPLSLLRLVGVLSCGGLLHSSVHFNFLKHILLVV